MTIYQHLVRQADIAGLTGHRRAKFFEYQIKRKHGIGSSFCYSRKKTNKYQGRGCFRKAGTGKRYQLKVS